MTRNATLFSIVCELYALNHQSTSNVRQYSSQIYNALPNVGRGAESYKISSRVRENKKDENAYKAKKMIGVFSRFLIRLPYC